VGAVGLLPAGAFPTFAVTATGGIMDVEQYTFFPTNATFSLKALLFCLVALLLGPQELLFRPATLLFHLAALLFRSAALLFRLQVRPFVMVNIIFQLLHVIHLPLEEKSMDKSVDRYRNLLNSIELYFANNEIACIILMKRQFQVKSSGFQVGDGKI
jgi:hypothetical protein